MTKSDLIELLAVRRHLPKGRAEALINCVFDSMAEALRMGERIEIRGFGSFEIRSYKSYAGRNPRTGTVVPVKAKRLPFFKVGKELRERVAKGRRRMSGPVSEPPRNPGEATNERTLHAGATHAGETA